MSQWYVYVAKPDFDRLLQALRGMGGGLDVGVRRAVVTNDGAGIHIGVVALADDDSKEGGFKVVIGDMDGDGKPDCLGFRTWEMNESPRDRHILLSDYCISITIFDTLPEASI